MSQSFYDLLKLTHQAQREINNLPIVGSETLRILVLSIENKLLAEIRDFERRENEQEKLDLIRKAK